MSYTYHNVITETFTMSAAGVVEVDGVGLQGFPSGAGYWTFRLSIDGEVLFQPGGNNLEVTVSLGGMKACAVGSHTLTLDWAGDTNVQLAQAFLKFKGFNNTSG